MSTPEAQVAALSVAAGVTTRTWNGQELYRWNRLSDTYDIRYILEGQVWFRQCCGEKLARVVRQEMPHLGHTAPAGSRHRRSYTNLVGWLCLTCGWQSKRE